MRSIVYKLSRLKGWKAIEFCNETNSVYAEKVLTNRYTLEKLLEAEPTLKDKILNFFKGASKDYADVPKLSKAAKKYYKTYKKLFDEFSNRNAGNNEAENSKFEIRNRKAVGGMLGLLMLNPKRIFLG